MENEIEAVQTLIDKVIEFAVTYSFQILGAVIILVVGSLLAKWISTLVKKLCNKTGMDVTLGQFLSSLAKIIVLSFAIIIAIKKFGIDITPFIAAIGAIAFGLTYAIQGPLSNYGAGLAIILGRPFILGDTINVADVGGVVDEIKLAHTRLTTADGIIITIPNKHIVGEILHNSQNNKLAENSIGISYSDSPEKAIKIIEDTIKGFDDIAQTPPPQIGLDNFGDSSVNIEYRYWVPTKKYYDIYYAVNLKVFNEINKAGITIPFPQRDVTIVKEA